MRIVALLMVVALVYLVFVRRSPVAPAGNDPEVRESTPVAAVARPATPPPAPPAGSSSGLRQPLDRTRSVLDDVKKRNGAGEF